MSDFSATQYETFHAVISTIPIGLETFLDTTLYSAGRFFIFLPGSSIIHTSLQLCIFFISLWEALHFFI